MNDVLRPYRPFRWYEGIAPVTAKAKCSGVQHRITWRRGRLACHDHDVEAERALAALGAEPPVCLHVLDLWAGGSTGELLPFLARGRELLSRRGNPAEIARAILRANPNIDPAALRSLIAAATKGFQNPPVSHAALPPRHPHRAELEAQRRTTQRHFMLANLPDELFGLLLASASVWAERAWHDPSLRDDYGRFGFRAEAFTPHIEEMVRDRAAPALEESVSCLGRRLGPRTTLGVFVVGPDEIPSIQGWAVSGGAGAAVSLRPGWLARVWANDLAVVDGCFVLDVLGRRADGRLSVLAVRWVSDLGGIRPVAGRAEIEGSRLSWLNELN